MSSGQAQYVGRENLEIMEDAHNYNQWLVELAAACFKPNDTVLDFGAGTGTLTRMLRDRGFRMLAIEPDEAMARELESAGFDTARSLDAVPDGGVAGIVSFNVLEHIEDDARTVRAFRDKLHVGGMLFLYVPAFPLLFSSMDRQVGHLRRYRRRALVALLERSGFRIESCRHADSIGFLAALTFRLFGPRSGMLDRRAVRLYDQFVFPVSRVFDRVTAGAFGKNLLVVGTADT
ncbi:MAG: class I SAM-dependent methyltransferase [Gammaproteobacteria bacterium]